MRRYDILDSPPDGAFDRITALAARLFDVPIAIVSVVDIDRIWFASRHGLELTQVERDPGLCASAVLGGDAWIVSDAARDPRTLANPLVAGSFGLRFYAGVPLTTHDGFNLGTLCVIDREPRPVTDDEKRLLTELAAVVMDELELRRRARLAADTTERRLRDLEHLAGALQASLLPPSLPRVPFLEVAARYRPASRFEVGGDFYDVFPIDLQSWGFVIGDVMGKGPQAAGRTSSARYSIRAAAIHEPRPSAVLQIVNQSLLADADYGPETPFVTALFARAERKDGRTVVRFASAGHPLPTLLRAEGRIEVVGTPGTLLGVLPALDVTDSEVELQNGDTLLLITDGVHDSGIPFRLGQTGLEAILRDQRGTSAVEIVERVHHVVSASQRDDTAILAVTAT